MMLKGVWNTVVCSSSDQILPRTHNKPTVRARCLLLALLFSCTPSKAENSDTSHWYLGGQMGWGKYQNACGEQALDCADSSPAFGFFGGYQLSPQWQIELGYLDPENVTVHYPRLTTAPLKVTGNVDIVDLSLIYGFPLTAQWQLQLRGGAAYWQAESNSREFAFESDGVNASAGLALEWAMNEFWAGRLGYQYVHGLGDESTGGADLHLFNVGMRYRFGAGSSRQVSAPLASAAVPAVTLSASTPSTSTLPPTQSAQWVSSPQWVYFSANRDYTNQLGHLAPIVGRLKNDPQARVELIGYSNTQGTSLYTRQLSQRRAEFVAGYLQSHNIRSERMIVRGQDGLEPDAQRVGDIDDAVSRRVLVRILENADVQEVKP